MMRTKRSRSQSSAPAAKRPCISPEIKNADATPSLSAPNNSNLHTMFANRESTSGHSTGAPIATSQSTAVTKSNDHQGSNPTQNHQLSNAKSAPAKHDARLEKANNKFIKHCKQELSQELEMLGPVKDDFFDQQGDVRDDPDLHCDSDVSNASSVSGDGLAEEESEIKPEAGGQTEDSGGVYVAAAIKEEAIPVDILNTTDGANLEHSEPLSQATNKGKDSVKDKEKKKKRKKSRINMLLWPGSVPQYGAFKLVTLEAMECPTTSAVLHSAEFEGVGTIWSCNRHMINESEQMVGPFYGMSYEMESHDLLMAITRLRTLVEPNVLSLLLGSNFRTSDYCSFVLTAFLGLVNHPFIHEKLNRNKGWTEDEDPSRSVVVFKDGSYIGEEEDDEDIVFISPDGNSLSNTLPEANRPLVNIVKIDDSPHSDPLRDPLCGSNSWCEELVLSDEEEESFMNISSYIVRNYMKQVCGVDVSNVGDFRWQCEKLGIEFDVPDVSTRDSVFRSRLWKWEHGASTPAPDLGPTAVTSRTTLPLWKHALETMSTRDLSRCSLIHSDAVIKTLSCVAMENPVMCVEELMERIQPVACIAPKAVLFLAEQAAHYTLQTVLVAIQCMDANDEENDDERGKNEENKEDCVVINCEAIEIAGAIVQRDFGKAKLPLQMFGETWENTKWKFVDAKPFTKAERVTLCHRTPKIEIEVPLDSVEEVKHTIVSFFVSNRNGLIRKFKFPNELESADYTQGKKQVEGSNGVGGRNNCGNQNVKNSKEVKEEPRVKEETQEIMAKDQEKPKNSGLVNEDQSEKKSNIDAEKDMVRKWRSEMYSQEKQTLKRERMNRIRLQDYSVKENNVEGLKTLLKALETMPNNNLAQCVCIFRLTWMVLHALGIPDDSIGDSNSGHALAYGSEVDFSNFGQLRLPEKRIEIGPRALISLAIFVDGFIRDEAEILMWCAAHDDGRPWIDGADVALIKALRKM